MNNDFKPNEDVKQAIQSFNDDFNERCNNETILKEIAKEVLSFSNDISYNFNDPESKNELQKEIDKYLFSLSKDPKITEEINHSKFPDDVVLIIIRSRGININDISILKSFEAIEIQETKRCGYNFNITFESMVNSLTIECDIVSEDDEEKDNLYISKVISNKEMWNIVNRIDELQQDPEKCLITDNINKTKIPDIIITELIHRGNPDLNLEDFEEISYGINPNNTYIFLGKLKGQDVHFNILQPAIHNVDISRNIFRYLSNND